MFKGNKGEQERDPIKPKETLEEAKKRIARDQKLKQENSNQRELFDWVEKAIKSKRYAVHISVVTDKNDSKVGAVEDLQLESINIITDMPLEDTIRAVKSFKEHIDKQLWR